MDVACTVRCMSRVICLQHSGESQKLAHLAFGLSLAKVLSRSEIFKQVQVQQQVDQDENWHKQVAKRLGIYGKQGAQTSHHEDSESENSKDSEKSSVSSKDNNNDFYDMSTHENQTTSRSCEIVFSALSCDTPGQDTSLAAEQPQQQAQ